MVKATLILADAASAHPDGTFSLLRGGITEVNVPPNRPAAFLGALVARVPRSMSETGTHAVKIGCVNEDGGEVAPPIEGGFEIPPQGGASQLVLSMQLALPRLGRYEFAIAIDKHQLDTWAFEAKEAKPKT